MYKHLFGPVPSRRLGLSLGLDLLNSKTCSFDCIFCEVGRTSCLTADRKEYVAPGEILEELKDWIKSGGKADHITLAGRGEPTLNTSFGEVIRGAKELTKTPVALLSNGSLFFLEDVRIDAACADIVKVSLGAWNQESMERLNKPCSDLSFDAIIKGYHAFRALYKGEMWIEVLLVAGINDHVDNLEHIAEITSSIGPDRIQINTVVRPPAEASAAAVGMDKMELFARLFDPPAEVAVSSTVGRTKERAGLRDIILRRPCTLEDLSMVTGMNVAALKDLLTQKSAEWGVVSRESGGAVYYSISPDQGRRQ